MVQMIWVFLSLIDWPDQYFESKQQRIMARIRGLSAGHRSREAEKNDGVREDSDNRVRWRTSSLRVGVELIS
jgi:hypothetical protein